MVLLVQPLESNTTYLVDVGIGGNGLAHPIILSEGEEVMGVSPSDRHRLARSLLPDSSLESTPGSGTSTDVKWTLQVREEFSTRDAIATNFIVSQMYVPDGLFCNHVVCVKHFVVGEEEKELLSLNPGQNREGNDIIQSGEQDGTQPDDEPIYMSRLILLGKQIKKHFGPNTTVIRALSSEKERILALKELFGIDVGDVEEAVEFVRGRKAALDSKE